MNSCKGEIRVSTAWYTVLIGVVSLVVCSIWVTSLIGIVYLLTGRA